MVKLVNEWHLDEQRVIRVVDDFFESAQLEKFARYIQGYALWKRDLADDAQYSKFAQMGITFDAESFTQCFIWEQMAPELERLRGRPYYLYTAQVNHIVYGEHNFVHRDCDVDSEEVTVLVYLNDDLDKNAYGETVFYDERDEVLAAVRPVFGRVAMFSGAIQHCARQPARPTYAPRLTLALKTTGDAERAAENSRKDRRMRAMEAERRKRYEIQYFGRQLAGY